MEHETQKYSHEDPFDFYKRRGEMYQVSKNHIVMDVTPRDFELLLLKHGFELDITGAIVSSITGFKKTIPSELI